MYRCFTHMYTPGLWHTSLQADKYTPALPINFWILGKIICILFLHNNILQKVYIIYEYINIQQYGAKT